MYYLNTEEDINPRKGTEKPHKDDNFDGYCFKKFKDSCKGTKKMVYTTLFSQNKNLKVGHHCEKNAIIQTRAFSANDSPQRNHQT